MNKEKIIEVISEAISQSGLYGVCNKLLFPPRNLANCLFESLNAARLLNFDKPTGAITEAAHSANTNVERSAASEDVQSIGDGGAGSSETAVVGQNEQVKKPFYCNNAIWFGKGRCCNKQCNTCIKMGKGDYLRPPEP